MIFRPRSKRQNINNLLLRTKSHTNSSLMTISLNRPTQFSLQNQLTTKVKRSPKLHQEEAINAVIEGFKKTDRGQLIMACGTGKTLTSFWIRERLNSGLTLVLLPSLNLVSQTLKEWEKESESLNWICVCSDNTVAKDKDEWVVNASDLGISVTSDVADIEEFMVNTPDGIIFSTYQSSSLIAKAQETFGIPQFDLAIADESHRCAGKVSSSYALILDDAEIKADKRLFMTATPRVLGSRTRKKAEDENIEVACMDDESVFGKPFFELKFSEAIKRNLLCDYKVVVVGVDNPTVQSEIARESIISAVSGKAIDSKTLANHIAISKAIKDYSLSRVITFHGRVKGASNFCDNHQQILDSISEKSKDSREIKTGFVCGDMRSNLRNREIRKLEKGNGNEVSILTNARCLSEGVDIPTLDGIAFIDPRSSVVDIVQAVGRAIRKSDDKSHGYIILPVYLGDAENIEDEILESRFKEIWKIILALKSQDDTLNASLDSIRIEDGKRGKNINMNNGMNKIIFDLPDQVSKEFADSISTQLVEYTTDSWMGHYGKLLKWKEVNGHTNVPSKTENLSHWVNKNRNEYRKGILRKERVDLLNEIGFEWNPVEEYWMRKYSELVNFIKENGHGRVICHHPELGAWVANQRSRLVRGKMKQKEKDLLDKVGFVWDPVEWQWQVNYEKYKECFDKGIQVTSKTPVLGIWQELQRQARRQKTLSQEKINLLNALNFKWNPTAKMTEYWETKFIEFQEFVKQNGNGKIPRMSGKNQHPLARWVNQQRTLKMNKKMSTSKIKRLEDVGFIWNERDYVWMEKFNLVKEFAEKNGHAKVPLSTPIIGSWVDRRRFDYKIGKLSQERIDLIESIKGWVWACR